MSDAPRELCIRAMAVGLLLAAGACGGGGGGSDRSPRDDSTPDANRPPSAGFTISSSDGPAPLEVTFDGASSSDPDGRITDYAWEFGDGSTANGSTVSHTFTEIGSFDVTLTVTDDGGLTDAASGSVRVRGASVAGVIRISAGSSVDSDVNDRLTTPVANNGFGDAQPVGNPVQLGGFVNLPGTGSEDGNFRTTGDPEDFFVVELEGDEHIVLSIGEPGSDLDLELYNDASPPELIDASISPDPADDPSEDLAAPAEPGRYYIRVAAVSGASTYVLHVSDQILEPQPRRAKRLTDPIVAGEILVVRNGTGAMPERLGVRPARAGSGLRLEALDRADADAPNPHVPEPRIAEGAALGAARRARLETLLAARRVGAEPSVAIAEPNTLRRPQRVPNDPLYRRQWHFRDIGLESAWNITTGSVAGRGPIVVAVVDTGVLLNHPDLRDQLLRDGSGRVTGYDFIQDPSRSNDGDGLDPDPADPGDDDLGPGQGSFHGTHVAGLIAARSDNGAGVAGVAWQARLMPLRALGVDGGSTFDVIQAMRYAAQLDNVSGTVPPVRADIINMSLGSDFHSESEQQAVNQVRARGVFVVASVGNAASRVPSYPAAYNGVIGVGAVDRVGNLSSYSNFGSQVDLTAPGGDLNADRDGDGEADGITSTIGSGGGDSIDPGYGLLDGTSMAAAHVSGVLALMKSVHPELTPGQFDTLLRAGRLTRDAGPSGFDDRFGWGVIDAHQAVLTALEQVQGPLGPVISVTVDSLDFQTFTRELQFGVSNVGNASSPIAVSDDAPWLTVEPLDVDPDGFGQYRAMVDRTSVDTGSHRATITIAAPDDARVQPASVEVTMEVLSADPAADAGQHYVMLLDDADEPVAVQTVTAGNGQYAFELQDVPPGEYRLFAGTDLDDDDTICDGGEACGAYPSLAAPETITVDPQQRTELTDLDFASEFRTTATVRDEEGDRRSAAHELDKPEPQ
ncbi:MAG TPA: S8 family serine peptidase [Pseudomonadales bacterium]